MEWYRNQVNMVEIVGMYDNDCVKIVGFYENNKIVFFEKTINFWKFQEVLSEDLYSKYSSKIEKIEKSIPTDQKHFELWIEAKRDKNP